MHSLPDDALPETPFLSPFCDRACPGFVSLLDSIPRSSHGHGDPANVDSARGLLMGNCFIN